MRRINKNLQVRLKLQAGLSLIEIMVALLLGALLILGISQTFISNSQSFRLNEASARTQETGRVASDVLARALRNAGYFGCFPVNGINNNLDQSSGAYEQTLHDYQLAGITADEDFRPEEAVDGADFFMVSGVRGGGVSIAASEKVLSAADIKVTNTGGLAAGDIVFITDCEFGDIFQLSGVPGGGAARKLVASESGSPGNDFSTNSPPGCVNNCLSAVYNEGARIMRAYNEVYYIGENGEGERALFFRDASGNSYELVAGVRDMRVRYGKGTRAGGVDSWEDAGGIGSDWSGVIAVQISLLVRGGESNVVDEPQALCYPGWQACDGASVPLITASDRRLYRVYTFTTNLRNRI